MKNSELREKSIVELKTEVISLLKELFNLRMQKGMGNVAKPHVFPKIRREIARIKTILREKEQQA